MNILEPLIVMFSTVLIIGTFLASLFGTCWLGIKTEDFIYQHAGIEGEMIFKLLSLFLLVGSVALLGVSIDSANWVMALASFYTTIFFGCSSEFFESFAQGIS